MRVEERWEYVRRGDEGHTEAEGECFQRLSRVEWLVLQWSGQEIERER